MEQRAGGRARRLSPHDLAETIWDSLSDQERGPQLAEWVADHPGRLETVDIPEGKPKVYGPEDMLHPCGIDFKVGSHTRKMDYASPEQAALVARLALLDLRGKVKVPAAPDASRQTLRALQKRLAEAEERFNQLAADRTGDERLQHRTTELLMQWFIHGRARRDSPPP
jgi:hypothetical protein